MSTLLTLEITEAGVAHVRLNRPEKRNAMSFDLLKELVKTAKKIEKNKAVRVVILSGEGSAFSAGIDLADLNASNSKRLFAGWELIKPGQSLFQKAFLVWQQLPVPVISVLHGYCLGAGMQLALASDIRISTPTCKLAIMESRWGLVPDMGLTQTVRDILPLDVAKELSMTGRVIEGIEAKALGLVTHINDDPMALAEVLAEELIQRSPDAVLASKRVLNAMALKPSTALRLEKIWQLKLILGKNSQIARLRDKKPLLKFVPRQFK